jgi:hypothetical protein
VRACESGRANVEKKRLEEFIRISPETRQEQLLILEVAHLIKLDLHDLNCSILVS